MSAADGTEATGKIALRLRQYVSKLMREGGVGTFVLTILGSFFRFSHLKTAVFRFWYLVRFAGFALFSLWFSVFKYDGAGFFGFFCPMHYMVFLVLSGSYLLHSR